MNNIGKKVKIKNYFNLYNDRIGTIIELNNSNVSYTVEFNDGKLPNECFPYIETHRYAQCELIEEEFVLPKKWFLVVSEKSLEYINKARESNSHSLFQRPIKIDHYGVVKNDHNGITGWAKENAEKAGFIEITLEQFKQYVLKKNKTEMKIGDKLSDYTFPSEGSMCYKNSNGNLFNNGYKYNLNVFSERYIKSIENGYFLVSGFGFGWFKLNEKITKKQTNMEKKIIGYKFKEGCEKFNQAAVQICQPTNIRDFNSFEEQGCKVNMTANSVCKDRLESAKVLDLWFEPVYENLEEIKVGDFFMCIEEVRTRNGKLNRLYKCIKANENQIFYEPNSSIGKERCKKATAEEIEKFPIVEIKGYQAIIKDGVLEFGCQSISKEILISLRDLQQRDTFKFECSIDGTKLTAEIVNKLLKLYETS